MPHWTQYRLAATVHKHEPPHAESSCGWKSHSTRSGAHSDHMTWNSYLVGPVTFLETSAPCKLHMAAKHRKNELSQHKEQRHLALQELCELSLAGSVHSRMWVYVGLFVPRRIFVNDGQMNGVQRPPHQLFTRCLQF